MGVMDLYCFMILGLTTDIDKCSGFLLCYVLTWLSLGAALHIMLGLSKILLRIFWKVKSCLVVFRYWQLLQRASIRAFWDETWFDLFNSFIQRYMNEECGNNGRPCICYVDVDNKNIVVSLTTSLLFSFSKHMFCKQVMETLLDSYYNLWTRINCHSKFISTCKSNRRMSFKPA